MKPTFLVIGAAKAGTTTFCRLLAAHPEVFFARRKELHYFSFDETFARGPAWYERWFEGSEDHVARGEGSTTYSGRELYPDAARRAHAYDPSLRILYVVREPFSRMESVWMQLRRLGATSPFRDLGVDELPEGWRVDADFDRAVRRQSAAIVDSTNYHRQLEPWKERFGPERVQVVVLEELVRDRAATLARAYAFLGVDPSFRPEGEVHANAMAEYAHPREFLWRLWSSPRRRRAWSRAASLVPIPVKAWANRRFLHAPVAARPTWTPETRRWAWERLGADLHRFRAEHGIDGELWRLPELPSRLTPG